MPFIIHVRVLLCNPMAPKTGRHLGDAAEYGYNRKGMIKAKTGDNFIHLRGVRVHNLKNIDVDIPGGKFVAVTGLSGSGKSSLVLDTLYAEGQRRYVESFSAYARQFLERMDKPDVDRIEHIPPAIAIERKNPVKNRRSTVGTATEVNDYLRLLFARIGEVYCPDCDRRIETHTVGDIVSETARMPEDTRFTVSFPLKLSAGMELREQLDRLREQGFIRIFSGGRVLDIASGVPPELPPAAEIEVIVDRLVASPEAGPRVGEAAETCYRLGRGACIVRCLDGRARRFHRNLKCTGCGRIAPELRPQLFSFNSALGACDNCSGYGSTIDIDPRRVVPDPTLSLRGGAIQPWNTANTEECLRQLLEGAPKDGIPIDSAWEELTAAQRRMVMEGTSHFYGVMDFFRWMQSKKYKLHVRVLLSRYRRFVTCPQCEGARLRREALAVRIRGRNIAQLSAMTISGAHTFFHRQLQLSDEEQNIVATVMAEITNRLHYLKLIGLGYITLSRATRTLSGGEMQRVNLATSLGSALVNTLYILDEPTVGLHPRDSERLLEIIRRLRSLGNTVVVVEHEQKIIRQADCVLELGPGAGELGGKLVYCGDVEGLMQCDKSVTGAYMSGRLAIDTPARRRTAGDEKLVLHGCSHHNLKNIDVEIPLGLFTCVTGVSGSGKSTLVEDTLYGAIKRRKPGGYGNEVGAHTLLEGEQLIDDAVLVDQSPIGRTPRSNPATYMKFYGSIRKLFALTREARIRNLSPGTFSFNTAGGRCEKCKGAGRIKVDMQFLADIDVLCDTCRGRRFHADILKIKYKGRSIHDVLAMSVSEAMKFFSDQKAIVDKLRMLYDTGLGYIRLGQAATTLSGGEAQRLKMAKFMTGRQEKRKLMIFDEPTVGLHCDDIKKLIKCFEQLLEGGHTVLVVEHNLDVIKCADYVIDLGPEEGQSGGYVVASGTPEDIAGCERSVTGQYLKDCLFYQAAL